MVIYLDKKDDNVQCCACPIKHISEILWHTIICKRNVILMQSETEGNGELHGIT